MPALQYLKETTSTNSWLQAAVERNEAVVGDAVYSFYQTEGRGQKGNRWLSEPDKNLLISVVLDPKQLAANRQFLLSMRIALALKNVLKPLINEVCIKWPNDLYVGNRKIAGMLLENQLMGTTIEHSMVGIGLNVNQTTFPMELPNPTSLAQLTGQHVELHTFAKSFHTNLLKQLNQLEALATEELKHVYLNSLYRKDGFHAYLDANETFNAKLMDVTELGYLVLELESGEQRSYEIKTLTFLR